MLNAIKSKVRRSRSVMSERGTSGGLTNSTDSECPDDKEDLDPRVQVIKAETPPTVLFIAGIPGQIK